MNKPNWIKRTVDLKVFREMQRLLSQLNLNTVCFDASCPNISTCFKKNTATFLILGNVCTRNCRFCGISHGKPEIINEDESLAILKAVRQLKLNYVIITSVTRDDLKDQGISYFIKILKLLRIDFPNLKIELLIPDLFGSQLLIEKIIREKPDVIAHNIETVRTLYSKVRPDADYDRSLNVLKRFKKLNQNQIVKTGFMVGLGETMNDIRALIEDISSTNCDILTVGQYLQPSKEQVKVQKYYEEKDFRNIEKMALENGLKKVLSGPFIRSSFNGFEVYKSIVNN
ncbi:MAG: lipoyl synthase [Candidatus Helarchaeota archaeon]